MLHRIGCRVDVFQVESHVCALLQRQSRIWKGDRLFKCFPIFPKDVKQQWHNSIYEQRLALKISNIHAQTLGHDREEMKRYNFHVALLFSQPFCTRHLVAPRSAFLYQERASTS